MVDLQLDDDFINEVGMGDLSDEEKTYFRGYVMETLMLRIGTRLSETLSEDQLKELEEKVVVEENDSPEVIKQKQGMVNEWLKANHSNYPQVVAEEVEKIKRDMRNNAAALE